MRERATALRRNTCVLSTSGVLKDSEQQPSRGSHLIQVNRKSELVVLLPVNAEVSLLREVSDKTCGVTVGEEFAKQIGLQEVQEGQQCVCEMCRGAAQNLGHLPPWTHFHFKQQNKTESMIIITITKHTIE